MKKKRKIPLWAIPTLIAMATLTVWLRLTIVRTTYTITQTDKMISNMQHEREKASMRVSGLRSPRRLELLAHTKFNLNQPRADQVVHLK